MSQCELDTASDGELRDIFEQLCVEMSKCPLTDKYNRLGRQLYGVFNAIKSRGPDTIRKFLPLLSYSNPEVRLSAAVLCYNLASEDCRSVLVALEKLRQPVVSAQAMVFLYDHDEEFRKKLGEEADRAYGRDWRHPK